MTRVTWILLLLLGAVPEAPGLLAQDSTAGAIARPGHASDLGHDISFEQIFLDDGLSQSIVKSIVQDARGFMWFGTEDGLNKYDGYKFTVLRHAYDDPLSLSYNEITALHLDRNGYLWIGTFYGGLNRYDPRTETFVHFRNDPDDPKSLSHSNVNVVYEDRAGALWVGTEGGLNKLVATGGGDAYSFERFMQNPNDPTALSDNMIRAVCEDREGALWVGTDDGLHRLDRSTGRFARFRHNPADSKSLSHNSVSSILTDRSGILWAATRGGGLNRLLSLSETSPGVFAASFKRYRHRDGDAHTLSDDAVNVLFEDSSGRLWAGTNSGGLNLLDRETESFTTYRHDPSDPTSLSFDQVMAIYEDQSGLLWIGTYGGGIDKLNRKRKRFALYRHEPGNPNSLSQKIVWSICEDSTGMLWVGTHGGGLDRVDRESNLFTNYAHDPANPRSLSNNAVRLVFEDRSGRLWVATNGGGLCEFHRDREEFTCHRNDPADLSSLSHNELRAVYEDSAGVLWIGTNGGGLNRLVPAERPGAPPTFVHYRNDPDDPASLSNDFVRVIYEDSGGALWIGTQGGGLEKMDRKAGTFRHYRADFDDPEALTSDYIFSIHEDPVGDLWLGTWGGGLNRFDRKAGKFSHFLKEDGLPDNSIYGLLEDRRGNLWLSTNNGIAKFNPKDASSRNYTLEDGLQDREFNGGSFFKSRTGEMFFGGINGITAFFPEQITDSAYIPPIVITTFQKLNREVRPPRPVFELQELALSHKDYVFSFEFAALDYTAPERNLYAYRMDGLDEDWIHTDAGKRFATYTTLSPGRYVFRVKGSNSDGVWNEQSTSLGVVIEPPFWKTWWFVLFWGMLALALGYAFYQRHVKTVRLRTELRAAHDAQMSIMPQCDPMVEGYDISGQCIPANEVGGDFFDFIWLDQKKTRLGLVIGDVSGKAMRSAMTAVMTSGLIYSICDEDIEVDEIMTRINRPMLAKTDKDMFTALCLVSISVWTEELDFTNAGLEPPLLKSGESVAFVEGQGPKFPLGTVADVVYERKRIRLNPGDVLVLYTDGVSEAQNHAGELYGAPSLKALLERLDTARLSSREIKEEIIADVYRFAGAAPQHDDITLSVVKVKPPAASA